jgi:hypothetical protein
MWQGDPLSSFKVLKIGKGKWSLHPQPLSTTPSQLHSQWCGAHTHGPHTIVSGVILGRSRISGFHPKILLGKMLDLQHQYNNPSHEGGSHMLGPTLMWRVVVQLLYWCCTRIKSLLLVHSTALVSGVVIELCWGCTPIISLWDMIPNQLFTQLKTQLSYVARNHRIVVIYLFIYFQKAYDSLPHKIVMFLVVWKVGKESYL